MEIGDIKVDRINIDTIGVRNVNPIVNVPSTLALPKAPPVTLYIGIPIVDMPGCVEAHQTNNPKNNIIKEDDESGNIVLCDGHLPSFNPINYNSNDLPPPPIQSAPPVKPKAPEVPKTPDTSEVVKNIPKPQIECPTADQRQNEPVGFIFDFGRQKVIGYQLQGNECVRLVEGVSIPEQAINALPATGQVVTTATIAVVATTSALVAKPLVDLLLKVVKPLTKKVVKKIASIRGKQIIMSVEERRIEQRERNHAIYALRQTFKVGKKKR